MEDSHIKDRSQAFDTYDFEIAAVIVDTYLAVARKRWRYLEGLYDERFSLESNLSRLLFKQGAINEAGIKRCWNDLDQRIAGFDVRQEHRRELDAYLVDLSRRLRSYAKTLRVEEVACAA